MLANIFAVIYLLIVVVTFMSVGITVSLRTRDMETLGKTSAKLGIISMHGMILGGIGMNIIHCVHGTKPEIKVLMFIFVVYMSFLYLGINNWKEMKVLNKIINKDSSKTQG